MMMMCNSSWMLCCVTFRTLSPMPTSCWLQQMSWLKLENVTQKRSMGRHTSWNSACTTSCRLWRGDVTSLTWLLPFTHMYMRLVVQVAFWHMKNVSYVVISVILASQTSVCGKNFNVAIFLDTVYMLNVKLCMIIVVIELYPFIPLPVTLTLQGQSCVKLFQLKILCFYQMKLKLYDCLLRQVDHENTTFFFSHSFAHVQGR